MAVPRLLLALLLAFANVVRHHGRRVDQISLTEQLRDESSIGDSKEPTDSKKTADTDGEEEEVDPELHFGAGMIGINAIWELKTWMPDSPGSSAGFWKSKSYQATFAIGRGSNVQTITKPKSNECLSTCKITDRGRCNKMGASIWGTKRTYIAGAYSQRTYFMLCCIVEECSDAITALNYEVIQPQRKFEPRSRAKAECLCCNQEAKELCDEKNKKRCVDEYNLDKDDVLAAHCFSAMRLKPVVLPVAVDGYRAWARANPHHEVWFPECQRVCEQSDNKIPKTYSTEVG